MLEIVNKVLNQVFGNKSDKDIKELRPLVEIINGHFASYSSLSNDQLRGKTIEFKKRIQDSIKEDQDKVNELKAIIEKDEIDFTKKEELYEEIDAIDKGIVEQVEAFLQEILPEAFAVVKETSRRFKDNDELEVTLTEMDAELAETRKHIRIEGDKAYWNNTWEAAGVEVKWEMVHYDVQLIGGMVLHGGKIAEMATGEGKTLVATLPVYLNALSGRGVHVVTVNDYLAKRDSEWMAPIFQFHGLTIDCIDKHQPNSESRRAAYRCDVTYGTNNEFGFDYLRDNMAGRPKDLVQRCTQLRHCG